MYPNRLLLVCLSVWLLACEPNAPQQTPNGFDFDIVLPVEEGAAPLILLSHGSGGDLSNHRYLMNALRDVGYIVVSMNHPGNTTMDNSDAGVVMVWHRPQQLTHLLNYLLNDSPWRERIDQDKIGALGFSSGGYSVIALAGAEYDPDRLTAFCNSADADAACSLATDLTKVSYEGATLSYRDQRIQAVVAMSPAVGAALTRQSLSSISIPTLVMAAKDDELVDPIYGAHRYAEHIPEAELLMFEGGHFVFMECSLPTRIADWFIADLDLCGQQFEVDRDQVQTTVATEVVSFFDVNLRGQASP